MKERPILFNDEMVRALLDGRKTQTRRLVKPQPVHVGSAYHFKNGKYPVTERQFCEYLANNRCPYGQPGDRMWVREAWQGPLVTEDEMREDPSWAKDLSFYQDPKHCAYRASGDSCEFYDAGEDEVVSRWKPSIHMPRWACRLLLEVTAVRVERLQSMTEDDAEAEGCQPPHGCYKAGFIDLWRGINGPDSWDTNPWVWVVEFRRIDQQQEADAA